MKILMAHDPYAQVQQGSVGGEDNIAELQIASMRELGHEVFDARKLDQGFERKKNQIQAQLFGTGGELFEIVQKFKPDVVHTQNLNQRSGYAWMKKIDVPIVSSIHNFRLFCPSSIAWKSGEVCFKCRDNSAFNAILYQCADVIGAVNSIRHLVFQRSQPQIQYPTLFLLASEKMQKVFEPIIPSEKIRILRNPSTPSKSFLSHQTTEHSRDGWIFSGRLSPEKGILNLISIWPEDEKLDIAGNGPLLREIEKIVSEKPNIKLIGTYPPGDHSIFTSYEGLIFPSTWIEGSPLVVMESLGTGTPVICGDVSAAAEQVSLTKGGVVISGDFTQSKLISAIGEIRSKFNQYSHNAVNSNRDLSSIDVWKVSFESYLREAITLFK